MSQSRENFIASFRQFQAHGSFIDVRLTGSDPHQTFDCHRLVLSSFSEYLHRILKEVPDDEGQVSVIIPDMGAEILSQIANYLYGGEEPLLWNEEVTSWFRHLGISISKILVKRQALVSDETADEVNSTDFVVSESVHESNPSYHVPNLAMKFQCPFKSCSTLIFSARDEAETHIFSNHGKKSEEPIPEEESKITFEELSNENETDQVPKPSFSCSFKGCQKTFVIKRYYTQHLKTHEKKSSNCELCGKILAGPRELKAHLRVHTGEKPYQCQHCGMAFRNRSTCNTHTKLHNNKRNHVCLDCNHAFIQRGDLRKHMRSKHTNEKPFSCNQCGKKFARSDYLLKHVRAHRKNEAQHEEALEDNVEEHRDVNALLSEAMLVDDEGLPELETSESIELLKDTNFS